MATAKRYFTLEEANQQIPWLASVFQRLQPLRDKVAVQQQELAAIVLRSRGNGGTSAEQELARLREELNTCSREIQHLVQEVTETGIVVRDLDRGLVDFPHRREGREVYLCWIEGEDQVRYWHETDVGFARRQPL